ncbi:hypothetical protein [Sinomicrobium sp. M5D2P9]
MKEEDTLYQGALHNKSVAQMYKEAEIDYNLKQNLTAQIEKKGVALDFNYFTAEMDFTVSHTPEFIKETISELLRTMNLNRSVLNCAGYFKFNIKTPELPNALLQGATSPESGGWEFTEFTLNQKAAGYKQLENKLTTNTIAYLKETHPGYRLHPVSKTMVNADTFDEAVRMQFLCDRKETASPDTAAWKDPATAVLLVFFDIETQKIIRRELQPVNDTRSFIERWEALNRELPFSTAL